MRKFLSYNLQLQFLMRILKVLMLGKESSQVIEISRRKSNSELLIQLGVFGNGLKI